MLKLKELKISGVGRFVEEQVINFEKLGNLVQLDGQNNNTKDSSGAGKTTVFNALDYLFGINDLPNTILKSRLSEEPMNVEGIFDFDGKVLIIKRGKKLSVELDGELTTGSSKLAEEKLDSIMGMPRNLFRVMLHKRQKEGGFFLNFTPSQMNDFLTDCLGHSALKPKLELLTNKAIALKASKEKLETKLEATKSALKATQDAYTSIQAPIKEIEQVTVMELKKKYDEANQVWLTVQQDQKEEMQLLELTRPKIATVPFDRSTLEISEKECNSLVEEDRKNLSVEKDRQLKARLAFGKIQGEITMLQNKRADGIRAQEEAIKTANAIKHCRSGNCETCEQPWHNAGREGRLMTELMLIKERIVSSKQAEVELPTKEAEAIMLSADMNPIEVPAINEVRILELRQIIDQQRILERSHQASETSKVKAAQEEFLAMEQALKNAHLSVSLQASGQANLAKMALDVAANKMKFYEEARVRHDNSLKNLQASEAKYVAEVDQVAKDLNADKTTLEMVEEIKKAVKSYLSCSFDDALESIGTASTNLIRNIPNMAGATVQLEGMKETKDGKIKEEVNAVINMDGEERIPIKSLSGGERTSVDLAVDLSVIDYVESKTNKGIDLFVLDEPFNGLDTVCTEMALEVLKNSTTNKKLVIVDHNPEVKQMVESRLVVVRDGATSRISQS